MNPTDSTSNRIMELELQLMHLQKDFESLNEVVLEQHRRLEEQQRNVERLIRKLETGLGDSDERSLEDEKPPHY